MEWSPYQQAVYDDMAHGEGHTVIAARAGSGKTTTITEGVKHVPKREKILLCAFSKPVEQALKDKMKSIRPSAHVQTLHAFGRRVVFVASKGKVEFEHGKMERLLDEVVGSDATSPYIMSLRFVSKKVTSLAKSQFAHTPEQIDALMDAFGIVVSSGFRERIIDNVLQLLDLSKKPPARMDFDDQVWLPEVLQLEVPRFDRVLIDEMQDMTPAQARLALRASDPKRGRICAIGDDRQAIFAWRGAYAGILDDIVIQYKAKRLSLPISYRCPRVVIDYAKQWVPDIEAAPNAIEGTRKEIEIEDMMSMVGPDDFILSRTNAPLVTLSFKFIRQGRRVRVAGRDNGQRVISFIQRSGANSVGELLDYTDQWIDSERDRLGKRKRATVLAEDLAETVYAVSDGAKSVSDCMKRAGYIFGDDDTERPIVLSSVHKAKGLERDRVFLLDGTLRADQGGEEANIAYVAATRARIALYHVKGFEKPNRRKK